MGVKLVLEYVLGQGILERKKDFLSLETGTPILSCFFFFFNSNEGSNLQYLFCGSFCQVVTAMGVSRRQGDILNRSWESLPTETSSLYGYGGSSPWIYNQCSFKVDALVPS